MASESERCVDELLFTTNRVNELSQKLTSNQTNELLVESRRLIVETQLFIANNKSLIPSYILKKVTDSLRQLEKQVEDVNKAKMTFKFTSSGPSRSGGCSSTEEKEEVLGDTPKKATPQQVVDKTKAITSSNPVFFGFRERTNEELCMNASEVDSKDVSLVDLSDCTAKIIGLANTLYIRNLKRTTVLVCLACRAITITDCSDCDFKFVCQQLRIDSTTNCTFTIFTSARSMLESSKGLTFKKLDLDELAKNEKIERNWLIDYLRRANFNEHQNNWKCIDDFDWLSPTSASINYKICE
uniref:Tubulin-specific chaperone C n=1 Tax=Aceria tosichella TaxID=561515 RepID=A0A6G1SC41_9ACAR